MCIDCVIVVELSVLEHHDGESAGHLSLPPGPLQVVVAGHAAQAHLAHHDAVLRVILRGLGPGQHGARPLGAELLVQHQNCQGHRNVPHVTDQDKQGAGDEHHADS